MTETVDIEELAEPRHRAALPHTRVSAAIDAFLLRLGDLASWLWLALLTVIVANVTLRYAFGAGRIEFEELQWHLYSAGFLVGLSYCVQSDSHIRVDVLRDHLSPRMQSWIELYGILLLLLPFIALVLFFSFPYVVESLWVGEVSPSPGGLPYRWAMKACIPAAFVLLALATISRLLRVASHLFGAPVAQPPVPPSNGGVDL